MEWLENHTTFKQEETTTTLLFLESKGGSMQSLDIRVDNSPNIYDAKQQQYTAISMVLPNCTTYLCE